MIEMFNMLGSIKTLNNEVEWSKEKLREEINKRVEILKEIGINSKFKIIILHANSQEFFADLLSIWGCGACAICLNPKLTNSELKNIIEFTKSDIVLINEKHDEIEGININFFNLAELLTSSSSIKYSNTKLSDDVFEFDNDALILFTSGTTGKPKGVVHTFRSLYSRLSLNWSNINLKDMQVTLCPLPTYFGHGLIGNCLTPLLSGNKLILIEPNMTNLINFGSIIDNEKVTFVSSVPSMWNVVLRMSDKPVKETLQRVHIGSAPLSRENWSLVVDWSSIENVYNMYGITETANWIAGSSFSNLKDNPDGYIGKLWGGRSSVYRDGSLSNFGEGELAVQVPSQMKEYLSNKSETDNALKMSWFFTGDLAKISDNEITLIGRKKFEINKAGMKISPEELDMLIDSHPNIQESCAFSIADEMYGEIIGVSVIFNDKEANVDKVKTWLKEKIISEKIPDRWWIVDSIPKNDRGKIDRLLISRLWKESH
jgi:acyl-CoA synthetase (AMP-forming)/AMP-acid ligase II